MNTATATAFNTLTLGEVAAVENLSGQSIAAMAEGTGPIGKMLAAMAYVMKHRTHPDFKFEDALNLTMTEATDILSGAPVDPTE